MISFPQLKQILPYVACMLGMVQCIRIVYMHKKSSLKENPAFFRSQSCQIFIVSCNWFTNHAAQLYELYSSLKLFTFMSIHPFLTSDFSLVSAGAGPASGPVLSHAALPTQGIQHHLWQDTQCIPQSSQHHRQTQMTSTTLWCVCVCVRWLNYQSVYY